MLIGLTGRNAAGKGEVARYLQTKSFYYYSLSDVIRDEIRSRRLQPTRDLLIAVGNELRQKYGAKILAERVLARIEDDKQDRKSTRLNSSHITISYAVFCLKKKKKYY